MLRESADGSKDENVNETIDGSESEGAERWERKYDELPICVQTQKHKQRYE